MRLSCMSSTTLSATQRESRWFREVIDGTPRIQHTLHLNPLPSGAVQFEYNKPKWHGAWQFNSLLSECLQAGYASVQMTNPNVSYSIFIDNLVNVENQPLAFLHPMISELIPREKSRIVQSSCGEQSILRLGNA